MQNTCVTKKGKPEQTPLSVLQWKPIPTLMWDFNPEMIEKCISSKCIQTHKHKPYVTYHRNVYYIA